MEKSKALGKENVMGTKKVFPLLMSMAIPPMISMLIQSLYNIVDSFFVAKISKEAFTAVSLAYPLQNIVLAVAVGLGIGVNSCIARSLGSKDKKAVENAIGNGFILCTIHCVILILVGAFLSKYFISFFTSNQEILEMGTQYSRIIICFSFASVFHILIEKMFQSVGNMIIPMALQALGAVVNIILDPILIFGYFGMPAMGVRGAAIATVIGQGTACAVSVILFMKNKQIRCPIKKLKIDGLTIKRIYSIAVPSAVMMAMPSVLVSVLNGILTAISQSAVTVFGLYYKLQTFVYMPTNGLVQGMRPLIGYNYGAKKHRRMKSILVASIAVAGIITAIGTAISLLIPEKILLIFEADKEMLSIGVDALRIISLGFVVSTVGIILSGAFEALGKGGQSLCVSLLRQFIIIPPLSIVLFKLIGLNGVWLSFPISEVVASIVAVIFLLRMNLFDKRKEEKNHL